MTETRTVTFYLPPKLRRQAEAGNHNFIRRVTSVLTSADMSVAFDSDTDDAWLRADQRPGHGLFLMQDPPNERCLTFRKTYVYPFWHIEKQAKRWEWPVAKAEFEPRDVPVLKAARFQRFWRDRLFEAAQRDIRSDGFVYVPLQGRLTIQRSFQSCSPLQMLETVLENDPKRYVLATLHPNESYAQAELKALDRLIKRYDRLFLGRTGQDRYLPHCDYIVTQNSAVGFMGYFLEKPLILFGNSDFHHIALSVGQIGAANAFAQIEDHSPNYKAYLFWFLQMQAINAGRPEAESKILATLRGHNWTI